jgi:hypothetical protein
MAYNIGIFLEFFFFFYSQCATTVAVLPGRRSDGGGDVDDGVDEMEDEG